MTNFKRNINYIEKARFSFYIIFTSIFLLFPSCEDNFDKTISNENQSNNDTIPPSVSNSGKLTASDIKETSLTLHWGKGSDNITSKKNLQYMIYISEKNNLENYENILKNGTKVTPGWVLDINLLNVPGLSANTQYHFNVIIRDQAGNISIYKMISVTTNKNITDSAPPSPGNSGIIRTSNLNYNSVTLNWIKSSDNKSYENKLQYKIYTSDNADIDTYNNILLFGKEYTSGWIEDINSIKILGLEEKSNYYFNIIVRDEANNLSTYKMIMVTTPAKTEISGDTEPPVLEKGGLFTIFQITDTSVKIKWQKPTDNVTAKEDLEYRIFYSTWANIDTYINILSNGTEITPGWTTGLNNELIPGLTPDTAYYFNVMVQDEAKNIAVFIMDSATTNK